MKYFQTKIPNLRLAMEDVYILWPFGLFTAFLVYFMAIWYIIFLRFGMLHQEKSGNPAANTKCRF
jgi:4-amino-4-deoxy-L-arabinose transferase-like glycosyltransferase